MSRRRSVYVEGFAHENPVPAACVIDNVLFTGAVHGGGRGSDPEEFSPDAATQCERMFERVLAIMSAAGGSADDIVKMSVRIASPAVRGALNRFWGNLFPDPHSRPARQVTVGTTQPHILVQCEVVGVLPNA
ncbi:RidA family protein [Nocardia callitridis]|uniref:RidA family protein n=1 Tax=Nocardia callitridis TaxID=648753 RepID=A0ABP9K5F7_9NOCA